MGNTGSVSCGGPCGDQDVYKRQEDYSGVFCQMKDEAGTDVMTFSAVGGNQSVWGVKYIAE